MAKSDMEDQTPRWLCIHTASGFEKMASDRLTSRRIPTLYPRQIKSRHYFGNSKATPVEVPLYPCYLFANCTLEQYQYAAIGQRKEVLRLLDFGSGPAMVSEEIIEQIKCRLDPAGIYRPVEPVLSEGDAIRVVSGPLAGYEGLFQRSDKGRVWALLRAINDTTLHEQVVYRLTELQRTDIRSAVA